MACLPDTNIWIHHLKQTGGPVEQRLRQLTPAEVFLCSVVKAELLLGARKYGNPERRTAILAALFAPFESLPFDDDAAAHYADIRHQLELQGAIIVPNDLQIAAIARAHGLTLVTTNSNEFKRVPGLKVEDWTQL